MASVTAPDCDTQNGHSA